MFSEHEIQSGAGKPLKQRDHGRSVNCLVKTKPPAILSPSHKWGNFLFMLWLTPGFNAGRKRRIYSRQTLPPISGSNVWFWFHSWLGFLILSHVGAPAVLLRVEILAVYTWRGWRRRVRWSSLEWLPVFTAAAVAQRPHSAKKCSSAARWLHWGSRRAGESGFDGAAAASSPAPTRLASPASRPSVCWPKDLKRIATVQAGVTQASLQKREQFRKLSFWRLKWNIDVSC